MDFFKAKLASDFVLFLRAQLLVEAPFWAAEKFRFLRAVNSIFGLFQDFELCSLQELMITSRVEFMQICFLLEQIAKSALF